MQLSQSVSIAHPVSRKLAEPKIGPGGRKAVEVAVVSVPETPMYKYDCLVLWEHQVWPTPQSGAIESVPEPLLV